jgi:hypothetical protein
MFKAPPISKDLIEYLEKVFPVLCPLAKVDADPHHIAAVVHHLNGGMEVIKHLRAIYEEQQNEDPLNVHESTKAP